MAKRPTGEPEPISWTLVAYARSTFAARYSRQHLIVEGAERTLCGIRPPVGSTSFGHTHSGPCARCAARGGSQ